MNRPTYSGLPVVASLPDWYSKSAIVTGKNSTGASAAAQSCSAQPGSGVQSGRSPWPPARGQRISEAGMFGGAPLPLDGGAVGVQPIATAIPTTITTSPMV